MKSFLRSIVRRSAFKFSELVGHEKSLLLSGQIRAEQIRQRGRLGCLADAEFSAFSQWGEDGIIEFLVSALPDLPTRFVEFGVEDFREANCRFLVLNRNWSGLVIDGSAIHQQSFHRSALAWKHDVKFVNAFVTPDAIQPLLDSSGFDRDLGILSVDIDGVDYWVLERITARPPVVVVEYNDFLGPSPVSVPNDPGFVRAQKHPSKMYWGASLSAFRHLLEGRGYTLLGTNSIGTNAFFALHSHAQPVLERLEAVRTFACKMRETAGPDGRPSFETYREAAGRIAGLELVDVVSGKTVRVGDVAPRR